MLLGEGRLIIKDIPARIIDNMVGRVFEANIREEEIKEYQKIYKLSSISGDREGVRIRYITDGAKPGLGAIPVRPSLEEVYLDYFG